MSILLSIKESISLPPLPGPVWTDLPLFHILNAQSLLGSVYTLVFNHVLPFPALLQLFSVRLTNTLLRFLRRVIVREDSKAVSEYIADYIICTPSQFLLNLHCVTILLTTGASSAYQGIRSDPGAALRARSSYG